MGLMLIEQTDLTSHCEKNDNMAPALEFAKEITDETRKPVQSHLRDRHTGFKKKYEMPNAKEYIK